ncbi:GNAT family N-acetyltransferase [Aceticella autotrophica]|uniref:GNAT family N-acetyltransferase n=1 Tax=Aceticella autotrophica TaxID=2755338 RepID=A0A974Y3R7_9THEO|nr:GNAT family N-acetyltransferase [Aceticella autotrophica]QSZ26395.1 GNAT family N-acetyltransferase [Aceticella autotrophica]
MEIREILDYDKFKVFLKPNWSSEIIVVHRTVYKPEDLKGFFAYDEDRNIIGMIGYIIKNNGCEIVILESFKQNTGIGTVLINKIEDIVKKEACSRISLITTNDNLNALGFYQKRGFRIKAVYPGAVNETRIIKPEIPLAASNGIPIRDEIELEK